jgi:hypothetical protein
MMIAAEYIHAMVAIILNVGIRRLMNQVDIYDDEISIDSNELIEPFDELIDLPDSNDITNEADTNQQFILPNSVLVVFDSFGIPADSSISQFQIIHSIPVYIISN